VAISPFWSTGATSETGIPILLQGFQLEGLSLCVWSAGREAFYGLFTGVHKCEHVPNVALRTQKFVLGELYLKEAVKLSLLKVFCTWGFHLERCSFGFSVWQHEAASPQVVRGCCPLPQSHCPLAASSGAICLVTSDLMHSR
jgi:hypothetical protein